MSTIEASTDTNQTGEFKGAETMTRLTTPEKPDARQYQAAMESMSGDIRNSSAPDIWSARAEAWETHVSNAEPGPLQNFAEVMLRGPYVNSYEAVKEVYESTVKHPSGLPLAEVQDARRARREAINFLIESNHKLRDFLESERESFTLKQFTSWYAQAREGKARTAESEVMGAAAEFNVKNAMEEMDIFRTGTVQYGDIEQDAHGMDIVGQVKKGGLWVGVDAKAGAQMPSHRRIGKDIILTVGVPTKLIDDHFMVDDKTREGIGYLIKLELEKTKHSGSHHVQTGNYKH